MTTPAISAEAPPSRVPTKSWLVPVVGATAGIAVALSPSLLTWIFALAGVAVTLGGVRYPRVLAVATIASVVLLPDFVGFYVPGAGLVNLTRVIAYSSLLVVAAYRIWVDREVARAFSELPRAVRVGLALLVLSWLLAVAAGFANGSATGIRAVNAGIYQALALWIGWRIVGDRDGAELVALTLALSLLYIVPFWVFDLAAKHSLFASYVAPTEGMGYLQDLLVRAGSVRAQAVFGHPLNLGQFVLLASPIVGAFALRGRWRALAAVSTLCGVLAMFAARSRSPWLAIVAAVGLLGVARRPRLALFAAGTVALAVVVSPTLRERAWNKVVNPFSGSGGTGMAFTQDTEEQFSAIARVFVVQASIAAIAARPVRGFGIGNISDGAGIPTIDNYYLRLGVESGLPTALAFTLAIAILIGFLLRRRPPASGAVFYRGAVLATTAYAAEFMLVGLRQTLPVLFLCLGVCVGLIATRQPTDETGTAEPAGGAGSPA